MKRFGEIKKPTVLLGSINYAFLDDLKGHYWFATDNGLFRADYQLNTYQRFGYGEGLRCQFVNVNGVKTDTKGNVWVGTSNPPLTITPPSLPSIAVCALTRLNVPTS